MANPFFTGVPTTGESPTLLSNIEQAVRAAGGTGVYVISAKRPPGPGNDVKNSNHITGDAMDGYAIIGGKQVPLGQVIVHTAGKYGLRSGDVAGFDPKTQGGYDPNHVDDGANVGGVKPYAPLSASAATGAVPTTSPSANSTAYFSDVLKGLGIKPTGADINFLNSWAHREGVPQNIDAYNLLGTTLPVNGSHGTNAPGVQDYGSYADGVQALTKMLSQGNFTGIRSALASGNPVAHQGDPALQQEFSSWSGGGYTWPQAGASTPLSLPGGPTGAVAASPTTQGAPVQQQPQAAPSGVGAVNIPIPTSIPLPPAFHLNPSSALAVHALIGSLSR